MANVITGPIPDVPLGRNTEATMDAWQAIAASVPKAPRLMRGDIPRKSPDLVRFDPGYPDDWPDASDYWQNRGFCVGWAGAKAGEFEDATPAKLTARSRPARPDRLSPLYVYALAREMSARKGLNLGSGDGAIVSHAAEAVAAHGFLTWAELPCDDRAENGHNNRSYPTATQKANGKRNAPAGFALLPSWDAILETLGAGRYVWVGTDWLSGMARTGSDGSFTISGGSLGGHSYLIVDYDLDRDLVWIKNSHPQWGMRSTAVKYRPSGGWTNLGVCKLSQYKQLFSVPYLNSGRSEALVIWGDLGFVPRAAVPG